MTSSQALLAIRRTVVCSILVVGMLCCGCSKSSTPKANAKGVNDIDLVCFVHIGSSDHPIFPVILVRTNVPREAALAAVQPLPFAEWAKIVPVSSPDLKECIGIFRTELARAQSDNSTDYGTFRIIILEAGSRMSKAISRKSVLKLLNALPNEVIIKNANLHTNISELKAAVSE